MLRSTRWPTALAELIAGEAMAVWKKTLNLEWWRYQVETKSQAVNELQKAWLENGEKKSCGDTQQTEASKIDNIESDELPSSSKARPMKELREEHNRLRVEHNRLRVEHNRLRVGGMGNPAKSVRHLNQMALVGKKVAGLWDEFVESHPIGHGCKLWKSGQQLRQRAPGVVDPSVKGPPGADR